VEFEDTSTLGSPHRIVEIDPIDYTDEPDTDRYGSRDMTEEGAKELDSLRRVQLGRMHFLFPAAHADGRASGSPQNARPLDFARRGPEAASLQCDGPQDAMEVGTDGAPKAGRHMTGPGRTLAGRGLPRR
jgi:hypothetical protein